MKVFHPAVREYEKFMESFKTIYPELYDKYNINIDMDSRTCGNIKVGDNGAIGSIARGILTQIIKEYYSPLYN